MLTSTQESHSGSSPTERMKMKEDSRASTEKLMILPNHLPKRKESIPPMPLRVQQVWRGDRRRRGEFGVALPALGAGPRPCSSGGSFR